MRKKRQVLTCKTTCCSWWTPELKTHLLYLTTGWWNHYQHFPHISRSSNQTHTHSFTQHIIYFHTNSYVLLLVGHMTISYSYRDDDINHYIYFYRSSISIFCHTKKKAKSPHWLEYLPKIYIFYASWCVLCVPKVWVYYFSELAICDTKNSNKVNKPQQQ